MSLSLFLLALAPALAIAWYIYLKDEYDREPLKHVVISFFLGVLSTIPAIALETILYHYFPEDNMNLAKTAFHAFIVVALSEELVKFIMLRFYAWRQKEFNEPFDGIVYGVMVSLGFAALENVFYVLEGGLSVGLLRMFTAVPAHASFGIIMGYYFGLAWQQPQFKVQYMLRGLMAAVLLHGVYDFFLFQQNYPAFFFFSFIGLGIAIKLSLNAIKAHQAASPFNETDLLS